MWRDRFQTLCFENCEHMMFIFCKLHPRLFFGYPPSSEVDRRKSKMIETIRKRSNTVRKLSIFRRNSIQFFSIVCPFWKEIDPTPKLHAVENARRTDVWMGEQTVWGCIMPVFDGTPCWTNSHFLILDDAAMATSRSLSCTSMVVLQDNPSSDNTRPDEVSTNANQDLQNCNYCCNTKRSYKSALLIINVSWFNLTP